MRVHLRFDHLPPVMIDCTPDECSQLLLQLGQGKSVHRALVPQETLHSPPTPSLAPVPKAKKRREKVLDVFFEFYQNGKVMVSLSQLEQNFKENFPEESTQNLDQVVRDLANKTNLIERCERGTFRLTDFGLNQFD